MTEKDGKILKARPEEVLALADSNTLLLTGVRVAEALEALDTETRQDRNAL